MSPRRARKTCASGVSRQFHRSFPKGASPSTRGGRPPCTQAKTCSGIATIRRLARSISIHSLVAAPRRAPAASRSSNSRVAATRRPPLGQVTTRTLSSQRGKRAIWTRRRVSTHETFSPPAAKSEREKASASAFRLAASCR